MNSAGFGGGGGGAVEQHKVWFFKIYYKANNRKVNLASQ